MFNRRSLLKGGIATTAALATAPVLRRRAWAVPRRDEEGRILVVVELSGGNDGLNTVVPYGDDAYYRQRPNIGIKADELLELDGDFGFNPGMLGFQRLWRSGDLAIIHGCGYEQPSYSHFTSMAYWHTGVPGGGDEFGWLGRLADALDETDAVNGNGSAGVELLINIASAQSLAVKGRRRTPVVFDDPERFQRRAFHSQQALMARIDQADGNPARTYLNEMARSALGASARIRQAWSDYRSPVDYGIAPMDLPKVAACIGAGLPARIYHVAFRNNAFDTHVQQSALHRRLLSYACDGIHGFIRDLERLGQAERVVVLVHSEFGRRVPENTNLGTDHGTANLMFLAGKPVKGGHYGKPPSLTALTDGENLVHTVDFRRVYATAIDGWMQQDAASTVLKGRFETLPALV